MVAFASIWWLLAVRGIAGVLFGVLAIAWPMVTMEALLALFAVYLLVDGAVALAAGLSRSGSARPGWPLVVEGLLGILVGAVVLRDPERSALAIWYAIALWALVTGLIELIAAVGLREARELERLLALAGLASVALAVVMLAWPGVAIVVIAWIIGAYAMAFGLLLLVLALRLKRTLHPRGGRELPV